MKTSNKIILGLFLSVVLIVVAIHIGLYAKYKAGKIHAEVDVATHGWKTYQLNNIKYVSVFGLDNCAIIPADTIQVKAWHEEGSRLLIRVVQDTLFVYGDSLFNTPGYNPKRRTYEQVSLYLPEMTMINGAYSQLHFQGSFDTLHAQHHNIVLHDAGIRLVEQRDDGRLPTKRYFKSFTIRAKESSNVDFGPNSMIDNLDIALEESMLNDREATIHHIELTVDDKSQVILQGANLKNVHLK